MPDIVGGSIVWNLDVDDSNFSSKMAEAREQVEKTAKDVEKNMSGVGKSITAAFDEAEAGSKRFASALAIVGTAALGLITKTVLTAARTETLGVAMNAVARATGASTDELAKQEASMKKQGIATQEARSILTGFLQSQLDITDASKLARVAQDLAVIAGENSSVTAAKLTEAIASQNTLMLRQFGIVTTSNTIFDEYAETLGKTASELDSTEKSQAFLNKILKEGEKVAGTYEAAMTTAGKKLGSLDRVFQEASTTIGNVFLPAFGDLIDSVSAFLKAITAERVEKFFTFIKDNGPVIAGIIIGGLVPAFKAWAIAMWAILSPLIPFIAIGAALGFSLKVLIKVFKDSGDVITTLWIPAFKSAISFVTEFFKKVTSKIGGVIDVFKQVFEIVKLVFTKHDNWELPDSVFDQYKKLIDTLLTIREIPIKISMAFERFKTKVVEIWTTILSAFERFKTKVVEVWGVIVNAFKKAVDAYVAFSLKLAAPFIWLFENVIEPISLLIKAIILRTFFEIGKAIFVTMTFIKDVIVSVWNSIVEFLTPIFETIKNTAIAAWTAVKDFTIQVFTVVKDFIVGVWIAISNAIKTAVLFIKDKIIMPVFNAIKDFIITSWNVVSNAIKTTLLFIKDRVIMPVFNTIRDFIVGVWEKIKSVTESVWKFIGEKIFNPVIEAKNKTTSAISSMLTSVKDKFNNIVSFLSNLGSRIVSAIVKPFEDAKRKVEEIGQSIRDAAEKINPFHKESPSLVENVTKGLGIIKDQFLSLKNISLPSVSGLMPSIQGELALATNTPSQLEGQGSSGGVNQKIDIKIGQVSSQSDVDTIIRELGYRASISPIT